MYAIIQTGGKQYKVSAGDEIFVEKLSAKEGEDVNFEVLAVGSVDGLVSNNEGLKDAQVKGKVVKEGKAPKITVFTYKPKKGGKRKKGHRQPYSKVAITELKYKDTTEKMQAENK